MVIEDYLHGTSTGNVDVPDSAICNSEVSLVCADLDTEVAASRDRPRESTPAGESLSGWTVRRPPKLTTPLTSSAFPRLTIPSLNSARLARIGNRGSHLVANSCGPLGSEPMQS